MCFTPAVKSNLKLSDSTRNCHTFRLIQNKLEVPELPLGYVVKHYITHRAVLLGEGI